MAVFSTPYYGGQATAPTATGFLAPAPGSGVDTTPDYGIWMGDKVVSNKTHKPWNGKEPRSGKTFANGAETEAGSANGVEVPYSGGQKINPNDPSQRYQPVDITKDKPISDATSDLLDTFKKATADSLKGFDDYLNQFKSDTASALQKSKDALNITPTVNTLTGDQAKYDASLDASTARQNADLEKSKTDLASLNAQNAATQRGIVQKEYAALPQYDAAGNAIADRQMQEVIKNLSRYKLGTGVPTGLGTDESKILAQGAADVLLPLKMAQINKQYDLYGNEAGVERGLYGDEQNRVANFNPAVAAREFSASQGTAQQEFQSGQATAQTIQALKERVSGLSIQQAIQFFDMLGVPAQIRQQILGGQISQLGQLAQLRDASRYRGLQDKLGVNLSQPTYTGFQAPGYPGPTRAGTNPTQATPDYRLPSNNRPVDVPPQNGQVPVNNFAGFGFPLEGDVPGPTSPNYTPPYVGDVNLPDYTVA